MAANTTKRTVPLKAKRPKYAYHRNLPHFQPEGKTFFVTFNTFKRWQLPELVRDIVLKHCLHDNGTKLHIHGLVVMPDHVYMAFTPLDDDEGCTFGLTEIMNGIKGASAHSVNKVLGRKDHV